MIVELPAQVYGKGEDNLFCRLVRAKEMQDKPVDRAVSFEWKAGDGIYPPVWALWVEPGHNWAILYCFEDQGNELAGRMRPHTLRKTAGLCTRADLPLITSLAAGKGVRSHQIVNGDHWRIDFEESTQPDPRLWNTCILNNGGNSHYHLRFNTPPRIDASVPKQDTKQGPVRTPSKPRSVGAVFPNLVMLILGGVAGYGLCYMQDSDIHTRYNGLELENQQLNKTNLQLEKQISDDQERYAKICDLVQQLNELCTGRVSVSPKSQPKKRRAPASTPSSDSPKSPAKSPVTTPPSASPKSPAKSPASTPPSASPKSPAKSAASTPPSASAKTPAKSAASTPPSASAKPPASTP